MQLFSSITNPESRPPLLRLLTSLTSHLPKLTLTNDFLQKANSWYTEQVDEPNFFERIDAFHAAAKNIRNYVTCSRDVTTTQDDQTQFDETYTLAAIHQSIFSICHVHPLRIHTFPQIVFFIFMFLCNFCRRTIFPCVTVPLCA